MNPAEIFEDINPNRDWSLAELFEHMASMSAMRRNWFLFLQNC